MICFYDRRHRLSRELENTITHVGGLRAAMMAAEFVLSFQRGPWSNNPWRLVLEEETAEFAALLATTQQDISPLVSCLLPGICRESGRDLSEVGLAEVQQMIADAKFLKSRGPSSMSRWDNVRAAWAERRSELSLMLCLLVSFGLKCSFLSGAKANKATWSEELAAANDDPNKATLKSEQMYRQCRNKLHVVTTTLLNSDLVARIQAWYCISVPLRNLTAEAGTVAELCSAVMNLNFTVTYKYTQDGNRPAIKPQVGNSAQCEIAGLCQRGMQLAGSCRVSQSVDRNLAEPTVARDFEQRRALV